MSLKCPSEHGKQALFQSERTQMLGSYVTSSSRSEFGVSIEENAQRGYEPILVAKYGLNQKTNCVVPLVQARLLPRKVDRREDYLAVHT